MNEEQLIRRLFEVVARKITHADYVRVTRLRKAYRQLVAGIGLDDLLRRFIRREDEKLFTQRVELTHHIVTAISENLATPFYKIPNSNSGRPIVTYQGDKGDEKRKELLEVLGAFWGNKSWTDYMATRYVELNLTDPNAFTVFEFKNFNNAEKLAQPYPYEVNADMAVDYYYKNNVLQYLIAKDSHTYELISKPSQDSKTDIPDRKLTHKVGSKYTLYTTDLSVRLLQIDVENVAAFKTMVEGRPQQTENGTVVKLGEELYLFETFKHGLDIVPAFRAGYKRDLATDGRTCVSFIDPVIPLLLKTVTVNSHLDLVASLLAMPQQIRIADPCEADGCHAGTLRNGSVCKSCNGLGLKATAPSAQDAILLTKPQGKDEIIPLDQVVRYVHPPVDIVKWQEDYVDRLTTKCKTILYNAETFSRTEISRTATGENLDMQNVYDTLYPFTVGYSKGWVFGVRTVAKIVSREKDLVVSLTFGKDFKFKTLDSLIADLSRVNEMNNPALQNHINEDIAAIIFAEKPLEKLRYETQQFFNPFRSNTEKEIMLLLSSNLVPLREKVLYANFNTVMDEVELGSVEGETPFYSLTRDKQKEKIYQAVQALIDRLEQEQPAPQIDLQ